MADVTASAKPHSSTSGPPLIPALRLHIGLDDGYVVPHRSVRQYAAHDDRRRYVGRFVLCLRPRIAECPHVPFDVVRGRRPVLDSMLDRRSSQHGEIALLGGGAHAERAYPYHLSQLGLARCSRLYPDLLVGVAEFVLHDVSGSHVLAPADVEACAYRSAGESPCRTDAHNRATHAVQLIAEVTAVRTHRGSRSRRHGGGSRRHGGRDASRRGCGHRCRCQSRGNRRWRRLGLHHRVVFAGTQLHGDEDEQGESHERGLIEGRSSEHPAASPRRKRSPQLLIRRSRTTRMVPTVATSCRSSGVPIREMLGRPASTVGKVLRGLGRSRLPHEPQPPLVRYERARPGRTAASRYREAGALLARRQAHPRRRGHAQSAHGLAALAHRSRRPLAARLRRSAPHGPPPRRTRHPRSRAALLQRAGVRVEAVMTDVQRCCRRFGHLPCALP